ncbi:Myb-like DNA-binding domain [Musa troglodytarum]|uniref:Myb-like DNA-binding domain n=1 Tax=Musa troglodytarum TaxID=320322 RepID=A0A9E7HSF1_9LILI|nr:Myb-like DNA-binding domain [Musa troglodytarum]
MSAPEVEKVANALKSSCVDLHKVVFDPLPDAVMKATEVLKNRSFGMTNDVEELEIQRQWEEDPIESSWTSPQPRRKLPYLVQREKTSSPLTIMENKKLVIRRKRKRWSSRKKRLEKGYAEVDLKDKWRNMTVH